MHHNFVPCILLADAGAMALHYRRILKSFLCCPIPIAYGKVCSTGKTTALAVALSPMGAYPSRFVSKATYEKYVDMCSSSFLPQAIDDPKSKGAISDLVISPSLMVRQVSP